MVEASQVLSQSAFAANVHAAQISVPPPYADPRSGFRSAGCQPAFLCGGAPHEILWRSLGALSFDFRFYPIIFARPEPRLRDATCEAGFLHLVTPHKNAGKLPALRHLGTRRTATLVQS
jgi:hypothetical protein